MDLPDLVRFHGDWERYVEELYEIYMKEVVNGGLKFGGLPVRCRRHPEARGKGFGFWHVIQEGRVEEERLPDLRRCERIRWIPWIIRYAGRDSRITWWEERRGSNTDVLLWLEEEDYLVILAKRRGYMLLKTAYCTTRPHKKRGLRKNRGNFWRSQND